MLGSYYGFLFVYPLVFSGLALLASLALHSRSWHDLARFARNIGVSVWLAAAADALENAALLFVLGFSSDAKTNRVSSIEAEIPGICTLAASLFAVVKFLLLAASVLAALLGLAALVVGWYRRFRGGRSLVGR